MPDPCDRHRDKDYGMGDRALRGGLSSRRGESDLKKVRARPY
jgi:hypothetical protein